MSSSSFLTSSFIITVVVAGLVYSAVFTAIFAIGGVIAPDFGLHNWPKSIQDRYGPRSAAGERVLKIVAPIVAVTIVGVVGGVIVATGSTTWLQAFVACFIALMTFNLYDLVVIDWIVICLLRPSFVVLKGTEDMREYSDWGFHAVGFLKGIVIMSVFSAVGATINVAVRAIM